MRAATSRKRWRGVSFVYLLFCEEIGGVTHVKIGKTNHPEQRLASYKTHCPLPIQSAYVSELPSETAALEAENSMLRRLSYLHGAGEWRKLNCGRQVEEVFAAAIDLLPEPLVRFKI